MSIINEMQKEINRSHKRIRELEARLNDRLKEQEDEFKIEAHEVGCDIVFRGHAWALKNTRAEAAEAKLAAAQFHHSMNHKACKAWLWQGESHPPDAKGDGA